MCVRVFTSKLQSALKTNESFPTRATTTRSTKNSCRLSFGFCQLLCDVKGKEMKPAWPDSPGPLWSCWVRAPGGTARSGGIAAQRRSSTRPRSSASSGARGAVQESRASQRLLPFKYTPDFFVLLKVFLSSFAARGR